MSHPIYMDDLLWVETTNGKVHHVYAGKGRTATYDATNIRDGSDEEPGRAQNESLEPSIRFLSNTPNQSENQQLTELNLTMMIFPISKIVAFGVATPDGEEW